MNTNTNTPLIADLANIRTHAKNLTAMDKKKCIEIHQIFNLNPIPASGYLGSPILINLCFYTSAYKPSPKFYGVLRLYFPNTSTYHIGTGFATGHGYHKPSAILANILQNMNIQLFRNNTRFCISGRGDSAIKEALEALCIATNYNNTFHSAITL